MEFTRSESSSSLESEIPTGGFDYDDETREYSECKEALYSCGVNFQSIHHLRSCQTLNPSFAVKNSRSMKDNDATMSKAGDKGVGAPNAAFIVAMIDQKMKEHTNNLLHAAHGISARITQLESRRRQLENLIDDVKDSIEFYQRRTERRLRELEDIMTEVQGGIRDLRDKQEIAEAQLQLAIRQLSSVNSQSKHENNNVQIKPVQQLVPYVHQQDQQQYPGPAAGQQRYCDVPPIAPSNPQHQTHVDQAVQLPQGLGQIQSQSIQQPQTWYQPPLPVPDSAYQKNRTFPTQSSVPHQPYMQSSVSPSSQLWYAPRMASPSEQLYSLNMNNQSLGSSFSKFHLERSEPSGNFNPTDPSEGSPFQYWSSPMKTSQPLSSSSVTGGDSSYTLSPTTKDLPRAIPMAKNVNNSSKSDGTDVSATEDIVEKVVAMGFRRDIVKATIRKLTNAGQSVDLNVVLDKLFNNT